jgi:hypothetical protein
MNPKTLFAPIEKIRAEVNAHVKRLASVQQGPLTLSLTTKNESDTAANVLDAITSAMLATTMEQLRVINDVKLQTRATHPAENNAAPPPVIDLAAGEYKEVPS